MRKVYYLSVPPAKPSYKSTSRFPRVTDPGSDLVWGKVTEILDGDTVVLQVGKQSSHVRLGGIDAAEMGKKSDKNEFFAARARKFLSDLVLDKTVQVHLTREPVSYDRKLGFFFDETGASINEKMVKSGLAFAARRFTFNHSAEYIALENEARLAGRGMWAKAPSLPRELQDLLPSL